MLTFVFVVRVFHLDVQVSTAQHDYIPPTPSALTTLLIEIGPRNSNNIHDNNIISFTSLICHPSK